ncbi:hypothetical protein ACJIZ3_014874 [Penstemon smallii]|uniref:Uncharacterized protein n=1 Tax=Penstemon smallii TaxID=265156 RepID=A0ABD3RP10_9LAMI
MGSLRLPFTMQGASAFSWGLLYLVCYSSVIIMGLYICRKSFLVEISIRHRISLPHVEKMNCIKEQGNFSSFSIGIDKWPTPGLWPGPVGRKSVWPLIEEKSCTFGCMFCVAKSWPTPGLFPGVVGRKSSERDTSELLKPWSAGVVGLKSSAWPGGDERESVATGLGGGCGGVGVGVNAASLPHAVILEHSVGKSKQSRLVQSRFLLKMGSRKGCRGYKKAAFAP